MSINDFRNWFDGYMDALERDLTQFDMQKIYEKFESINCINEKLKNNVYKYCIQPLMQRIAI